MELLSKLFYLKIHSNASVAYHTDISLFKPLQMFASISIIAKYSILKFLVTPTKTSSTHYFNLKNNFSSTSDEENLRE